MSAQVSYREYGSRERYSPALGGTVERLPKEWVCGRDCDIGGEPGRPVRINLVLMHPVLGIALIERETLTEGAEDILRERLEEARFGAIFGGYLPILHCATQPDELPSLAGIERAFGGMEPLSLAGGNAWLPVVAKIVMPAGRQWADNLEGAPNKAKVAPSVGSAPTDGRPYGRAADVIPLRRVASSENLGAAETEAEETPAVVRPWTRRVARRVDGRPLRGGNWRGRHGRRDDRHNRRYGRRFGRRQRSRNLCLPQDGRLRLCDGHSGAGFSPSERKDADAQNNSSERNGRA
ncbi:MAG: hypothetical protein EON94_07020, partial [Caulobacteraceae bacterium]